MNQNTRFGIVMGAALIAATGLFLAGCEVDSASSTIEITPDTVILTNKGDFVTLTCVGGYECVWSLQTETWGALNTRKGNQVVYTSLYQPYGDTPAIQIVTVVSKFTSMSGMERSASLAGATNIPTTNTQSAIAYIMHLGSGTTNSPETNSVETNLE